jgi:hypothetical protein
MTTVCGLKPFRGQVAVQFRRCQFAMQLRTGLDALFAGQMLREQAL